MTSTLELVVMVASIMMTCIILITVFGFRKERGINYLIGLIGCRIVYSCGVLLEKSSYEMAEKLLFRNVHQTALNLMVPFFLLFTLELIGRDRFTRPVWRTVVFLFFASWSMLMWFNNDLHMTYQSIELIDDQLITVKTVYSTTYAFLCYGVVAAAFYLLFQYIRNIRLDLRKPIMWVLFFASFSAVLDIVRTVNPAWSPWLLSLSVYCSFIGMLMLAIVLRFKFFSIVPFARNMVLDTLQESILIANASGQIIDSNRQATEWFAKLLGQASLNGRTVGELLAAWPEWQRLCESMQQGSVEIEAWIDGERRMYSVNVYPLHTQRKSNQGSISLIFDITEKQRHLEQIAHLSQLKDQLVTIVTHDIRAPLALQTQIVDLLAADREQFEPDHRAMIDSLSDQTRQTLGMTNNLLEWFRSQRDDLALRPMDLALYDVVEECCYTLRIYSEAKQLQVTYGIPSDTRVYMDREALGLILRNLLFNAIKYTKSGGSIRISARVSDNLVVVSVEDNGIGMEEEQVRQLFSDKPLQSLSGTSGEKGTGLGLLVTRQFVERSGGRIWVDSKPGEGSVFHFTMRGGGCR